MPSNLKRVDEVNAGIRRRDQQMANVADTFFEHDGKLLVSASVLGEFLGYKDLSNFMRCVHRAQTVVADLGQSIEEHFIHPDLYSDGDGMWLTPYAASMTIIEADSRKPVVAAAKSYFATLASDKAVEEENRLRERLLFKQYHKELHSAAEQAGVRGKDHALFDHYGYLGMYNRSKSEVKEMKGIPANREIADCAGTTELAANNLRMSMTRDSLMAGEARSPSEANKLHERKGRIVRKAVLEGTGTLPEHLAIEADTIDALSAKKKKELKDI